MRALTCANQMPKFRPGTCCFVAAAYHLAFQIFVQYFVAVHALHLHCMFHFRLHLERLKTS